MTAHELAKKLLEGPDLKVVVDDVETLRVEVTKVIRIVDTIGWTGTRDEPSILIH